MLAFVPAASDETSAVRPRSGTRTP